MPSIPKTIENIYVTTVCPDYPDHEAYFPNGTEAFTKKVENAILDSAKIKKGENILKAMLNFTVECDGSLMEVQVIGSNVSFNIAVEKAIKQIKHKWIPAKYDGNFVKSKIQLPITINYK